MIPAIAAFSLTEKKQNLQIIIKLATLLLVMFEATYSYLQAVPVYYCKAKYFLNDAKSVQKVFA
jgi:hypothetical protein